LAQSLINILCKTCFNKTTSLSHVKPTWREKKVIINNIKEDPYDKSLQIVDHLTFFMTKQVCTVSQVVKHQIVRLKKYMSLIIKKLIFNGSFSFKFS